MQLSSTASSTLGIYTGKNHSCPRSAKIEKFGFQRQKYLKLSAYFTPQGLISLNCWPLKNKIQSPQVLHLMKTAPKAIVNSWGFDFTRSTAPGEFHFLLLILISACLHFFKAQPDLPQTRHSPGCHSSPAPKANWQQFFGREMLLRNTLQIFALQSSSPALYSSSTRDLGVN